MDNFVSKYFESWNGKFCKHKPRYDVGLGKQSDETVYFLEL